MLEERLADHWDVVQQWDRDVPAWTRFGFTTREQVARQAERQHVERQADDERVRLQAVAEVGVDDRNDDSGDHAAEQADRRRCARPRRPRCRRTIPPSIMPSIEMLSVPPRSATYSPLAENANGPVSRTMLASIVVKLSIRATSVRIGEDRACAARHASRPLDVGR